jgi:hypothetical protein
MATAWKMCEDFATLAAIELAVASQQHTISHFLFHKGIYDQKQHDCHSHPPYLPDLAFCDFSLFPIILTQLRWSRQNLRWCWTPSQNVTSKMHLKMAETLRMVHMHGKGLLWGWWWPVGPSYILTRWQHLSRKLWMYVVSIYRVPSLTMVTVSSLCFQHTTRIAIHSIWKTT